MAYCEGSEAAVQIANDATREPQHKLAAPAPRSKDTKRELKDYSPSLQNAARALWGVSEIR